MNDDMDMDDDMDAPVTGVDDDPMDTEPLVHSRPPDGTSFSGRQAGSVGELVGAVALVGGATL